MESLKQRKSFFIENFVSTGKQELFHKRKTKNKKDKLWGLKKKEKRKKRTNCKESNN